MTEFKPSRKPETTSEVVSEHIETNHPYRAGKALPKVHFSLLSAIGVQYSVTGAPIAIGTYLSLTIGLGGSAAFFWGYFMMGFFQLTTCLAISELASAIPHSSGK